MAKILDLKLDRTAEISLAEQIRIGITAAIDSGVLAPGARLPSWLDLAAQLGVARGTVKAAYERLADKQLVVSSSPGGTKVADHPAKIALPDPSKAADLLPALYQTFLPEYPSSKMACPPRIAFRSRSSLDYVLLQPVPK